MVDRMHAFWNFKEWDVNETANREKMIMKINLLKAKVSLYELRGK